MCSHHYVHNLVYIIHCALYYTTDIDDLQGVYEAVVNVNQWFNLGLALGLKQPTLQSVSLKAEPK